MKPPVLDNPPQKIALTLAEVVEVLGISRRTIYKLLGQGQFPAPRHIGRRLLFGYAEVKEWFEQQPTK